MKYYLNWIPTGWNNPHSGMLHRAEFASLEELKNVLSNCYYNNEWVTDENNNRIDIDLAKICLPR